LELVEPFTVEADLPGGPNAAWRARRLVDSELSGRIPRTVLADVALLVTELVANGVRHGGAGTDAALRLVLEGRPQGRLRVEVGNPGPDGAVAKRPPDLLGGGGLGLHIVEKVASRWGVLQEPKTAVWFEVDL
jgi:anti-sigma regulatory factor (Ser/Thr protein kinase)